LLDFGIDRRQNIAKGRRGMPVRMIWLVAALLAGMATARAEDVVIPLADGTQLQAKLWMPVGKPVGPAIVALHGCAGPYGKRDLQWRELLVGQGHIMLFPNSFSSRGLGSQCRVTDRVADSEGLRRTDAIAAALWLKSQPGTPPGGVVLMGWSDGASTVMATGTAAPDLPTGTFAGLIAFYPGCGVAVRDPKWAPVAPLILLMGESDDWTPAKPCHKVAERFGPQRMLMIAYPGAYHDFDVEGGIRIEHNIPHSQNADKTVHVGTNEMARDDAMKQVPAFLAKLAVAH
jgi:dienelactone hydrolase